MRVEDKDKIEDDMLRQSRLPNMISTDVICQTPVSRVSRAFESASRSAQAAAMSALLFSTFDVSRQAFYRSGLAAAIVNLKPIVPGRALPVPQRRTHPVSCPSQMCSSYLHASFRASQTSSKTSSHP